MKLWIGLVGVIGLAAALDSPFTDEERAKACKCDKAPTDCDQNCRKCGASFIKKCGKKYAKSCKSLGFAGKTGTCGDDGTNCPLTVPSTCADCESLGKVCIKNNNAVDICKDLGFGKKGCPVICSQVVPSTCEDCKTLGIECIKQQGHEATCKALFWKKGKKGGTTGTCPAACPQVVPATCEDCKDTLGKECVIQQGKQKECKVFGYNAKKDTCPIICEQSVPTTCEDCEALGPICISQNGAKKTCKKLGFTSKNGCSKKS